MQRGTEGRHIKTSLGRGRIVIIRGLRLSRCPLYNMQVTDFVPVYVSQESKRSSRNTAQLAQEPP